MSQTNLMQGFKSWDGAMYGCKSEKLYLPPPYTYTYTCLLHTLILILASFIHLYLYLSPAYTYTYTYTCPSYTDSKVQRHCFKRQNITENFQPSKYMEKVMQRERMHPSISTLEF